MSIARLFRPILTSLLLIAALPALAINVERVKTPGGIEAWLVQDHTNPIITMRFAFRGGAALDPKGKVGLYATTKLNPPARFRVGECVPTPTQKRPGMPATLRCE